MTLLVDRNRFRGESSYINELELSDVGWSVEKPILGRFVDSLDLVARPLIGAEIFGGVIMFDIRAYGS